MMMRKYSDIEKYLDELYPNPKCELNYFNDYSLLIAIMLSAQTKDSRVNQVTKILFDKYKTLDELKKANYNDLLNIIKPLGNYNKKTFNVIEIAKIISEKYNYKVPNDRDILETLPGVGRKTANVFLSEYYKEPFIGVDTHVERVCKRLNIAKEKDNPSDIEEKLMKIIKKDNWGKIHLQLVLFGRYHCTSKKPNCNNCKIRNICKYGGNYGKY